MKKNRVRHDRRADDPGRQQHPIGAAERRHEGVKGDRVPVHRHEPDLDEKAQADD
jgi:hypothetical protein